MPPHLCDYLSKWGQVAAGSILILLHRALCSKVSPSIDCPLHKFSIMTVWPSAWLRRWAAPSDCVTWLQMVLQSWLGTRPEEPLRLHRICSTCAAHHQITIFNLDISGRRHGRLANLVFIWKLRNCSSQEEKQCKDFSTLLSHLMGKKMVICHEWSTLKQIWRFFKLSYQQLSISWDK